MKTKLVVGLGNPGKVYQESRHNVGFRCIDFLSAQFGMPLGHEKKKTRYGKKRFKNFNVDLLLLKPQTFSSLAAEAVLYVASFYKIFYSDIFVVYDDINANLGAVSVGDSLKDISHNGVKHIIQFMRNESFMKCGLGIGPLPERVKESDFYLSAFRSEEISLVEKAFKEVEMHVITFLKKKSQAVELNGV